MSRPPSLPDAALEPGPADQPGGQTNALRQAPPMHGAPSVYLASGSPRRRQLLVEMGIDATVMPPDVDDARLSPGFAPPADRVLGLAYLKARRVADQLYGSRVREGLVLGADTLCVLEGRMLGQPRDADDAREMLHSMRGRAHHTVTGVCLIDLADDRRILFHDKAEVRLGEVSDEQIEEYIASGEWRGKAGAYNLSERIAAGWPIDCDGDPASVMGLPVRRLRSVLERLATVKGDERPAQPERAA